MFLLDLCPELIVSIYRTLICVCIEDLSAVKTHSHTNLLPSEVIKQGRNQDPGSKPGIWTFKNIFLDLINHVQLTFSISSYTNSLL